VAISIEGYARVRPNVCYNFWQIAYGSLQESKYLTEFSFKQKFLTEENYNLLNKLEIEIGAMLWKSIKSLERYLTDK